MATILILDDDEISLMFLRTLLRKNGHTVFQLTSGEHVLEEIGRVKPDVVVTDIMMPGATGQAVYGLIRAKVGPSMPVIVSSATSLKFRREEDPLLAYCPKPVDSKLLLATIERLLEARDLDAPVPGNNAPRPSGGGAPAAEH